MFTLTQDSMQLVRHHLFAEGVPVGSDKVLRWGAPGAEQYLRLYKRRDYKTEEVCEINRSLYEIEYHFGEGSCCSRHPIIHDTDRSFVIAYDDIALGLAGFELKLQPPDGGRALVVSQIQGTRYCTRHSGRHTGAEAPARSISWQPALLNLIVAFAPVVQAEEVQVTPHHRHDYRLIRNNRTGNAQRLYDGTAKDCGFVYDAERELWIKKIEDR